MYRDDGLAAAGAADDDMRTALSESFASGALDDPKHLLAGHLCLAY
jgi:hypothetical protein